jgi:hypothetical protein
MKEARGIYRVRRIGGLGSDARVTDGATEMDVPESVYRARGYQLDFDKLPWKDKYDAKKCSEKVRPRPKAISAQPCRTVRCYVSAGLNLPTGLNLEVYARSRTRSQPLAPPVNATSHKP